MSSEDQVRPFHAKDEAHGQEAADAVAAVLKHAAERDKAAQQKPRPKKQPKWMLPVGIQLSVLALYLLIAPPSFITVHPIPAQDQAAQEESLRAAMYLQAQQVLAYLQQHGELPAELSEAVNPIEGIQYVRRGGTEFQLVGSMGELALVYDSTQSDSAFKDAAARRLAGG
jgi:hypothetical protein